MIAFQNRKPDQGVYNMRRLIGFFFTVFIILPFFHPCCAFSETRGIRVHATDGRDIFFYNDYHALVVGVSSYMHWPTIPNATKDAQEVVSRLKDFGFQVTLVLDPTYLELKSAFDDFVYEVGREENRALLFYYAGHGETLKLADGAELGFIIPKDCPLKTTDPRGFDNKSLSMKDMEVLSLLVRSKHFLMVFDSCFFRVPYSTLYVPLRSILPKNHPSL